MITPDQLYAAIDGTWPAAQFVTTGPWKLRDGQGGGKRVSAASTDDMVTPEDIHTAVEGLAEFGQAPLFMVKPDQSALDAQLAMLGYEVIDPCNAYAAPVEAMSDTPVPRVTILPHWEPLAIAREIWAEAGIGPARVEVMKRVKGPKVTLLGRHKDKPAGVAHVGIHENIAMLHALEILPHQRRQGMGQWFMRAAAIWAQDNGADVLTVICTKANDGANALYTSLGMQAVGGYHYRYLPYEKDRT